MIKRVNMAKCSRAQPRHVFTSALIDYNELEILEQQRWVWIEKTLWTPQGLKVETNRKRQCQFPDETGAWFQHGSHIWGNQRAVVLVSKQYQASSPLTCHDHACKLNCGGFLFCVFLCREVEQCFVWVDCVQGPMNTPPTVMTQLSCWRASPQSTVIERHRCVHSAWTLKEEMNASVKALPSEECVRGHLKNNDYVWSYLHRTSAQETETNAAMISFKEKGKSDQGQGHDNTGLSWQTCPVDLISFEVGTWRHYPVNSCWDKREECNGCHWRTFKSLFVSVWKYLIHTHFLSVTLKALHTEIKLICLGRFRTDFRRSSFNKLWPSFPLWRRHWALSRSDFY